MKKDLKYYRENAEEDYLTTPISVLRYIGMIESRVNSQFAYAILFIFISFHVGVFMGDKIKQERIENRAKTIEQSSFKTETITQQQLEYIIFNEIQE